MTYDAGRWSVKTAEGDVYTAKWFVAATGTSFNPRIPEWKGMEIFKGVIQHSSLWPEEPLDMTGERVAVIGAGSIGVQVMQEAPNVTKAVTHFLTTPNYAIPIRQRAITVSVPNSHRSNRTVTKYATWTML